MTEKQARVLAGETRGELVDLNGDGKPEIIAQANGLGPCGGTGNCIFWIFERTADGLRPLLNTNDQTRVTFEKILIRPWSTNGYKDIVLVLTRMLVAETSFGFSSHVGLTAFMLATTRHGPERICSH
jgi:hypothetical protein